MIFIVLGTVVGGSIVFDGRVHHGAHLFAGKFGFMLMDEEHSFSEQGTAINMASRYNRRTKSKLTEQKIFELAFAGDSIAQEEVRIFMSNVAKGIFNLTYAFEPQMVVIGGGISQADWLIPELKKRVDKDYGESGYCALYVQYQVLSLSQ